MKDIILKYDELREAANARKAARSSALNKTKRSEAAKRRSESYTQARKSRVATAQHQMQDQKKLIKAKADIGKQLTLQEYFALDDPKYARQLSRKDQLRVMGREKGVNTIATQTGELPRQNPVTQPVITKLRRGNTVVEKYSGPNALRAQMVEGAVKRRSISKWVGLGVGIAASTLGAAGVGTAVSGSQKAASMLESVANTNGTT